MSELLDAAEQCH